LLFDFQSKIGNAFKKCFVKIKLWLFAICKKSDNANKVSVFENIKGGMMI